MARDKLAPAIGIAGELRVRSELLLRELWPASFDFDRGTDIVLHNGKRIGVKTSFNPIYDKKGYSWKYSFSIRQPQVRNRGQGLYEKRYNKRDYVGFVDYWIFWCIQDNVFYIIPNGEVGQKISLTITAPDRLRKYKRHKIFISTSKYEQYKNNWEQLK